MSRSVLLIKFENFEIISVENFNRKILELLQGLCNVPSSCNATQRNKKSGQNQYRTVCLMFNIRMYSAAKWPFPQAFITLLSWAEVYGQITIQLKSSSIANNKINSKKLEQFISFFST